MAAHGRQRVTERRNAAASTTTMGTPRTKAAGEAYRRAIADRDLWMVAFEVFDELIRTVEGKHALQKYVDSRGDTDWVYLEELTSMRVEEEMEASGRNRRIGSSRAVKSELEAAMRYLAAFTLIVAYIRALHPDVYPPTWYHEEMAAVRGVPFVDKDNAEVIRDAFLAGRDQDALEILTELVGDDEDDDEE